MEELWRPRDELVLCSRSWLPWQFPRPLPEVVGRRPGRAEEAEAALEAEAEAEVRPRRRR
jgi:hypothetical protein